MAGRIVLKRRSKFNAVRTEVDGITFHSKKEAARYKVLCLLERAGKIKFLRRQVAFDITVNGHHVCKYYADFTYLEQVGKSWESVVEDCKGFKDKVYALKKKLVKAVFNVEIRET